MSSCLSTEKNLSIPKRIFLYWDEGFTKAPETVQLCVRSWNLKNPHFELVLLDDSNLSDWIDLNQYLEPWVREGLSIQKKANLIRAVLLAEHGGFWVDSTLYCRSPLAEWLDLESSRTFVALSTNRGQNRFMRNYFLGAAPSDFFITGWLSSYVSFLSAGHAPMKKTRQKRLWNRYKLLSKTKWGTIFWTFNLVARRFGYPYLIMHYLANRLILTRPRFWWSYQTMPRLFAGEALRYQEKDSIEEFARDFRSGFRPIWKLTWRTEVSPVFWDRVLRMLRSDLEGLDAKSHND